MVDGKCRTEVQALHGVDVQVARRCEVVARAVGLDLIRVERVEVVIVLLRFHTPEECEVVIVVAGCIVLVGSEIHEGVTIVECL